MHDVVGLLDAKLSATYKDVPDGSFKLEAETTVEHGPPKRDVLGTALLGVLAGCWRYAHLTALRGDTVNSQLPGMRRVVSEDAVELGWTQARQGLAGQGSVAQAAWLGAGPAGDRAALAAEGSGVGGSQRARAAGAEVCHRRGRQAGLGMRRPGDLAERGHPELRPALSRYRADCENVYDEKKNQWGWGGFTTHDLARCQLMARIVALAYIGGLCSPGWPSPIGIARRSPPGR